MDRVTFTLMRRTTPRAIALPDLPADLQPWIGHGLADGLQLCATCVSDTDFSDALASRIIFSEVQLTRVKLHESEFIAMRLEDVEMNQCDLARACWRAADFNRVRISESRMVGFRCNESRFSDLAVLNSNAQLAQFRYSEFESVRFENCDLAGADFCGADLRNSVFAGCNLEEAQFSSAKLHGADIRGSAIEGISIQPESLRGMIVEPMQAVVLSSAFGLVVKYD